MTTFVVSMPPSGSGALSELQVGPAEVLAAATMAHGAWGWIGGLRGLAALLRLAQDPGSRARVEAIFNSVEPDPTLCRVLAQDGLAILRTPDLGPFGKTEAEKLVSLTMCALTHIMAPTSAVNLFMDYFAESLIVSGHWQKKNPGAKDASRVFLSDRLQAILNEGTARQLPARFDKAIADARLATATVRKAPHPRVSPPLTNGEGPLYHGFHQMAAVKQLRYVLHSKRNSRSNGGLSQVGQI
jgi:hypothetical protein